jgi:hypothetical protein
MDRVKWALLIALACASGVFGAAIYGSGRASAQAAAAKVLRAQEFELVDSQGKVRAGLSVLPDGRLALVLLDKDGQRRAALSVLANGSPGLSLLDKDGKVRAALGVLPDGSLGLSLLDREGKLRGTFGILPDGSPGLTLFDNQEKARASLGVAPDGLTTLRIPNKTLELDMWHSRPRLWGQAWAPVPHLLPAPI